MNTKPSTVRALAHLMQETGLTSLEIQENDCTIRLERAVPAAAAPAASAAVPTPAVSAHSAAVSVPEEDPGMDFNNVKLVTSPMVGVFYAAPSPDREPFVSVGSRVREGDTLCIIEAMKLMNEITAECDGEIVDVCAVNGDVVEFGQTLFKII
ncbi:MAG: acetyl-CoA carboxylase biotin carboxyl carrier protein [Clostridiaceae bacterium]|nr:acetyl-CoA carboxylase biotin carboxyl carrier protein [Clostridiaceae bacterium]